MLKKLTISAILVALIASCSANKKSAEVSANSDKAATSQSVKSGSKVQKAVEVQEDLAAAEMFSVSAEEIKKSGTKPVVVYFDTNSSKLDDKAVEILTQAILPQTKADFKNVVIEAHCDERGSKAYNQKLSQKRANAVKGFLAKNGVAKAKIKALGYGETKPAAKGHDEASWAKNRRAVTIVIKK